MGNSTPEIHGYLPGEDITLGGFALASTDLFSSNTSLRFVGAVGLWELAGFNTFVSRYIVDPQYREVTANFPGETLRATSLWYYTRSCSVLR